MCIVIWWEIIVFKVVEVIYEDFNVWFELFYFWEFDGCGMIKGVIDGRCSSYFGVILLIMMVENWKNKKL